MLKIKEMNIGIRLAEAVISQKMVISMGIGVLTVNNPEHDILSKLIINLDQTPLSCTYISPHPENTP